MQASIARPSTGFDAAVIEQTKEDTGERSNSSGSWPPTHFHLLETWLQMG